MKKCAVLALTAVMATSILTVPANACPNFKDDRFDPPIIYERIPCSLRTCRPGDVDSIYNDVQQLHWHLNYLGYNDLDRTGFFGPKTEAAVRDFQEKHGLKVDGIVTLNVWQAMFGEIYKK